MPEMTGDGRLHFAVLGYFRVSRDGQEVDLGPRLQRALLAILVVDAGHVVPVDRLIDLLWREEPPAAALASVQAYISHLRRVLEPGRPARASGRVLVTQDPGYALQVEDDQVDALRFQALARQAHEDLAGAGPRSLPLAWRTHWRCGVVIRWPSSPPSRGRCRWQPGSWRHTTWPWKTGSTHRWRSAGTPRPRPSWREWWRHGRCGSGAGGS